MAIDFTVFPHWYSEVIQEAFTRNCPEALIIDEELNRLRSENQRMRGAIEKALADFESSDGWGPGVTVCEYLRKSIKDA